MHLLVRDTASLDDAAPAQDLGHTQAPIAVLSFSDADLGALAAAWTPAMPEMRLAPLAKLRHPMSVDLYVEQVVTRARCVVVRLLGGLDYFRYGAEEVAQACRANGIALAILPGDAADDTRLRALSTVPPPAWTALDAAFRAGGPAGNARALAWMAHLAGLAPLPDARHPKTPATPTAPHGVHRLDLVGHPLAAIVFYRSHYLSNDFAPIDALTAALHQRGLAVGSLYVGTLKDPATAAWTARTLAAWRPAVVLNATAFSARQPGLPAHSPTPTHPTSPPLASPPDVSPPDASPLDSPGVPVLQLVLAGSRRDAWAASTRGLSPADLAMHVVLPELDGRLLTAAISFKAEQPPHPALQYARTIHQPDPDGIALAADRAAGWASLAATARPDRRIAITLSDYPGIGGQQGHAVGLDTFASTSAILDLLAAHPPNPQVTAELDPATHAGNERPSLSGSAARPSPYTVTPLTTAAITHALCTAAPTPYLALGDYRRLLETLPDALRTALGDAWGPPATDPAVHDGHFTLRHLHAGQVTIALQPDRGAPATRRATYHDPDQPPRHAYVAFHLWLRHVLGIHALVHLGTHGSLEWLPGKAAALSPTCWPRALVAGLPVIYPFIVNNPGEAAAAKRRLGAVTIGHLTPPLARTAAHGAAAALERLMDEYAAADGLDRRRADRLRAEILDQAAAAGLLAESAISQTAIAQAGVPRVGVPRAADPQTDPAETLARLDAYLCDVKDLQVRHGLHVYGQPTGNDHASAASERASLLSALEGRFVPPGPAGAPSRGRTDVLPTGRNLTTTDPRAVPTRTAIALAERAADALLRRHLAEHGEYPAAIVLDLWGSATMRTGGEDLALAFVLLGARPLWDDASARVAGFEVIPIALLDRPRIDVTLRISGLFRDAFPAAVSLFDSLTRAIAARDEAPDWNPLATHASPIDAGATQPGATPPGPTPTGPTPTGPTPFSARVYGPAPGQYGAGDATAAGWTAASSTAYGPGPAPDPDGLAARLRAADAFVHTQDHAEQDLLDSPEYAAHQGGFFQAATRPANPIRAQQPQAPGNPPALYHLDTSDPAAPKPRTVAEEIVRIVRGRAANPAWIAAMMRHGRRGAAEITRPLAALDAYARTLFTRFDAQFDLLHAATLADPAVDAFLREHNPEAHADLSARFEAAQSEGRWHPAATPSPAPTSAEPSAEPSADPFTPPRAVA